jgi:hypothetical protein
MRRPVSEDYSISIVEIDVHVPAGLDKVSAELKIASIPKFLPHRYAFSASFFS